MSEDRTEIHYAERDGESLVHVYPSPGQVRMCGAREDQIRRVSVRAAKEGENPTHWGWDDHEDGCYAMIWPHRRAVEMCFTYGPEVEERRGRGKIVPLVVCEDGLLPDRGGEA